MALTHPSGLHPSRFWDSTLWAPHPSRSTGRIWPSLFGRMLTEFGQTAFGQFCFWWGPKEVGARRGGGPKISRFFWSGGAAGVPHNNQSQTCTFFRNTTKIQRDLPERSEKEISCRREKKKSEILGGPREGWSGGVQTTTTNRHTTAHQGATAQARQRRLRFPWWWGCRQCAHQSPLNVQVLVNLIFGISEVFSCRASVMRTVPSGDLFASL